MKVTIVRSQSGWQVTILKDGVEIYDYSAYTQEDKSSVGAIEDVVEKLGQALGFEIEQVWEKEELIKEVEMIRDDTSHLMSSNANARRLLSSIEQLGTIAEMPSTPPVLGNPTALIWVVNGLGELGVRINNVNHILYKGSTLTYDNLDEAEVEGSLVLSKFWRQVGKREFGECCHPINEYYSDNNSSFKPNPGWRLGDDAGRVEGLTVQQVAELLPGSGWWYGDEPVGEIWWDLDMEYYLEVTGQYEKYKDHPRLVGSKN